MKKNNSPEIIYDKAGEVLEISLLDRKSVDSGVQGNVVIDYGKNGEVVRINLYKFNFDRFKKSRKALDSFVVADK